MLDLDISESPTANMSGAEKAAALFLVLGKENAVKLASFFSKEEIKKIVDAASSLNNLSPQVLEAIVTEFGENFESSGLVASSDTLSGFFDGVEEQNNTAAKSTNTNSNDLSELDPDVLKAFFETEPPQIAALLLPRLDDEVAVGIISQLEPSIRNEIFHSYLNRSELADGLQVEIEEDLISLLCDTKIDRGNVEGIEKTASLINQFSEETSDEVVKFFEEVDIDTAASIKKSLFKFSSIVLMTKESRAVLLDGIESDDIVKALADADEPMREAVLDVLSQRNRRLVEAELSRVVTNPEDMANSQKVFIANALRLAREGLISLPEPD